MNVGMALSHSGLCKTSVLSISLPFEFLGPVPWNFMVGVVGNLTLQPMARTNHKFPGYGVRVFFEGSVHMLAS